MITRRAYVLRLPLVLVLFALPSLLFLHDRHAAFAAPGLIGRAAPDAAVWNSRGFAAHLSAIHGRPVWLNFFATCRPPCKEEMLRIEQCYQRYKKSGLMDNALTGIVR